MDAAANAGGRRADTTGPITAPTGPITDRAAIIDRAATRYPVTARKALSLELDCDDAAV
jgi:hypothetical protein